MPYKRKPSTLGLLHAIGAKGLVFVWDRRAHILHVRASGAIKDIDVIPVDKNSNIEAVIAGWVAVNKAIVDEQSRIAKFEQEARDRADALYAKEA